MWLLSVTLIGACLLFNIWLLSLQSCLIIICCCCGCCCCGWLRKSLVEFDNKLLFIVVFKEVGPLCTCLWLAWLAIINVFIVFLDELTWWLVSNIVPVRDRFPVVDDTWLLSDGEIRLIGREHDCPSAHVESGHPHSRVRLSSVALAFFCHSISWVTMAATHSAVDTSISLLRSGSSS